MPGLYFETMERCTEGKRVHEEDFDIAILPRIRRLMEKYEIEFNREEIIPSDDGMADRLFAASMEFAVDLSDLMDLDDPSVFQPGRDGSFAPKALQGAAVEGQLGRDDLQGDAAGQRDLLGLVDDPHSAAADLTYSTAMYQPSCYSL